MNILFRFLIILICFSCYSPREKNYSENKQKNFLVNKVRKKVSDELSERFGLVPFGSGGQMMNQVEMLMLAFLYNEPIDESKARMLLIASVNVFIDAVNDENCLKPYLSNSPFEPKNIQLEIYLRDTQERNLTEGRLSVVTAKNGFLEYHIRDQNTHNLLTVRRETFEEAKEILQTSSRK